MARDKLITVRIEGEKRQAFGDLAKSQNTDTASLLYDFINQCLGGEIDIKLVTGKGKELDNRIDSERIDRLETTTQKIDERVGIISKKLTDWVEAFDSRLNDCDQGLSNKMISLEHRLNALASQLDSQQLDRIDTDSQKDRQGENPDMGTVATVETADKVESVYTVETVDDNVEAVTVKDESVYEDEPGKGEGMNPNQSCNYLKKKGVKDISYYYLNTWAKDGVIDTSPKGKKVQKHLILRDGLYFPIN